MADSPCSMCSSPVTPDQLASGLAVRVSGEVVCPHCVDLLPTDAKVRINQMRALRGQASTPYRYRHPKFPQLLVYTFSTSAQLMRLRRLLHEGKILDAPEIAPRSAAPASAASPDAKRPLPRRALAIYGGGSALVVILILVSIAALGSGGPEGDGAIDDPVEDAIATTIDTAGATRADYPRRPIEAWPLAAAELPLDHPVLTAIADELSVERGEQLDLAAAAIEADQLIKAQDLLDRMALAPHVLLNAIERRELSLRVALDDARLANRPEPAPEPVAVAPQPDPEPVAPEPTPAPEPEPVATVEPDPPPEPAPPPTEVAPPTCVIGAAAALAPDPERSDWQPDGEALILGAATGIASRQLRLPEGPLRLWLQFGEDIPERSALLVRVDEQLLRCEPAPGWVACGDALEAAAGPTTLFELLGRGEGLRIERIALVDASLEQPADTATASIAWAETAADAPVMVQEIQPAYGGEVAFYEAFKPGSVVPEGLPSGVDPKVARSYDHKRFQTLEVPLGGVDCSGGGLALLVHSFGDDERLELATTLVDGKRRRVDAQPILFTGDTWHTVLLSVPPASDAFDPTQVQALVLRDITRETLRPFLVAKVVAVTGRTPTVEDLGISERALRLAAAEDLEELLDRIADQRRRRRDWRQVLDIDRLRILAGHQLITGSWQTQVYDELETLRGKRPVRGTLSPLMMHDPWLDETFIQREIIADRRQDIVVVATAGVEFPTGLSVDQALMNFWVKMIEETMASGILPVVVLGPTKVVPAQQADADELWARLDLILQERFPDIPVIDLRSVGRAHFSRFGPGQAQQSSSMLAAAVDELQARLRLLRDAGNPR